MMMMHTAYDDNNETCRLQAVKKSQTKLLHTLIIPCRTREVGKLSFVHGQTNLPILNSHPSSRYGLHARRSRAVSVASARYEPTPARGRTALNSRVEEGKWTFGATVVQLPGPLEAAVDRSRRDETCGGGVPNNLAALTIV